MNVLAKLLRSVLRPSRSAEGEGEPVAPEGRTRYLDACWTEFRQIDEANKADGVYDAPVEFDIIGFMYPRFDTSAFAKVAWIAKDLCIEVWANDVMPPTFDLPTPFQGNAHDRDQLARLKETLPNADGYYVVISDTMNGPWSPRGYFALVYEDK